MLIYVIFWIWLSLSCVHWFLVSMVQMTFYVLTKGYTVHGNQGTHGKLNQILNLLLSSSFLSITPSKFISVSSSKVSNVNDILGENQCYANTLPFFKHLLLCHMGK